MGSASATGEGVAGATPETDVEEKRSVRTEDLSQAHTRTASRARLRQPGLRQPGLRAVSPRPMLPRPRPPPRPSLRPLGLLTSTCTACALRRAQKTFVLPVWSPQLLARSDRHGDADSSSPGMLQSHESDSAGRFFRTARRFRKAKIRHSFSELNNICSETCGVRRRGRGRAGARFCPMRGPTSAMCSTKSSVPRKRLVRGSASRPLCRVFARATEGLRVRRDDVPVGVGWGLVVRDAALARAVDAQWGPFEGKLRAVRSELVHQEAGGRECGQGQRRSPGGGMPTEPGAGDRQGGRSGARRKRRDEPFPDG